MEKLFAKMNPQPLKFISLSLFVGLLSACAQKPFIDSRREIGSTENVGLSTLDTVAICYSSKNSTPKEIINLARSECAKTHRVPKFYRQSLFTCRLFLPHHAFYNCITPAGIIEDPETKTPLVPADNPSDYPAWAPHDLSE